uniref:Monodehydroascorbate reductase n=1 Tax=Tanacetum cinerariifolium TaxID=118510 RepID=A0A699IF88_TANCI|nr:hypothetical protein [Tanacetum cinerariifolium]
MNLDRTLENLHYVDIEKELFDGMTFNEKEEEFQMIEEEFLLSLEGTPLQSQQVQQPTLNEVQEYVDCQLVHQDVLLRARGSNKDTRADVNVNAPAGQAPTMAPPVRTDDQILPRIRWVPIGKSNCYLDMDKSQSNPIYKIAVDLLKHTNFFRAFTTSSTIPSIYIQQFWDTITPVNNNQAFISPPSSDALINFVNELGYPKLVRNLSNVVTNDMFQP